MTVYELIESLNRLVEMDEGNGDRTVLIGQQPNYPLSSGICGIVTDMGAGPVRVIGGDEEADEWDMPEGPCPDHGIEDCYVCLADQMPPLPIWILASDATGYASRSLWNMC